MRIAASSIVLGATAVLWSGCATGPDKGDGCRVPPIVRKDPESIRAWLDLACRQALSLEKPEDCLVSLGIIAESAEATAPGKVADLFAGLLSKRDSRTISLSAAFAAGGLAEKGHLEPADRIAAALSDPMRQQAWMFIAGGLARRGDAGAARQYLGKIIHPETLDRAGGLVVSRLAGSDRAEEAAEFLDLIQDPAERAKSARRAALDLARRRRFEAARGMAGRLPDPAEREQVQAHIDLCERLHSGPAGAEALSGAAPLPEALDQLVDSLIETGKLDVADSVARAIPDPVSKAGSLIDLAEAARAAGERNRARRYLSEAKDVLPAADLAFLRSTNLLRIAFLQWKLGDKDAALETCLEAEEPDPEAKIDLGRIVYGDTVSSILQVELGRIEIDELLADRELPPEAHALVASLLVWKGREAEIPGWYCAIEDPRSRFHATVGILQALERGDDFTPLTN